MSAGLVDAEPDLEVGPLGVVSPEGFGYVVGFVVSARRDAAADRRVSDVDAVAAEFCVEHAG